MLLLFPADNLVPSPPAKLFYSKCITVLLSSEEAEESYDEVNMNNICYDLIDVSMQQ